MSPAPRLFLCFAVAVGLLVNVCSTFRAWTSRVGLDLAALPEMQAQIAQLERDMAEKDRESRHLITLERRRLEITGDVIEGRMGLFEAAAHFRDLNAASADGGRMVRVNFAGSYDEQCCRQVIAWVHSRLAVEAPARVTDVIAELEATLQERLRQHGTICLQ
jgi:hypothetical protein